MKVTKFSTLLIIILLTSMIVLPKLAKSSFAQADPTPSPTPSASPSPTSPPGHCSGDQCGEYPEWLNGCSKIEEPGSYTAMAPEGKVITSVWIKAGSPQSGGGCFLYTSDTDEGCYIVTGIGTPTVTVTENWTGEEDKGDCKEISHVEFIISDPTPSPTPSASPSPTPSEEPTPTPTEQPTPTPTSTPSDNGGDDDDNGDSGQGGTEEPKKEEAPTVTEKQGQVLGVSTMAGTGSLTENILALIQFLGFALTGAGLTAYGKKKQD